MVTSKPPVTARFEVGLTTAYELPATAPVSFVSGDVAQAASATVGDLVPGRTYHYRMIAEGPARRAAGEDRTFTTEPLPVIVQSLRLPVVAPKASPPRKANPCLKLKGTKKAACIRRQAALKKCATLKPGAVKRACIVKAKRRR